MNQKVFVGTSLLTVFILVIYYCTNLQFAQSWEYSPMKKITPAEQRPAYLQHYVEKCNSDFLMKKFFQHNMSYAEGSWIDGNWMPSGCVFSNGKSILQKCFPDLKVRKMLILGDSNARRWGYATLKLLQKEFKCDLVKKETDRTLNPSEDYFKEVKDAKFRTRDCITCSSFLYQCVMKQQSVSHPKNETKSSNYSNDISHNASERVSPTQIDLEFLAMEYYMDNEMITQRIVGRENCKNAKKYPFTKYGGNCDESMTTQQFIFNEYLYTHTHYPTLIVIIGNNHEPDRRGFTDLKRDLTWFLELLQQVVHNNTKVYWIEPTYVSNKWRGKPEIYENYKNWALQVFSKYYESNPQLFYPFYGVFDLSKNKTEWHKDGMHYNEKLYIAFMELFFKTLCE